ncbi:unnamed protein product [Lepeophtheirus salmonis]|uniref:(salmon louse) hypothetical protein n=1 Tax=Lepeophtheirus salmonis TaxID=72036 RepID=A0A7R8D556_LEPSM|nr:unnamed protein product [Lepeophtheirus salmonis]CAF3030010.1 unnamed protein product [Lepeophtheirus salmonis]
MTEDVKFQVDPASLASILNNKEKADTFKRPMKLKDMKASRIRPKFGHSEKKKKATPVIGPKLSLSEQKFPCDYKPRLFTKTRRELHFQGSGEPWSKAAPLAVVAQKNTLRTTPPAPLRIWKKRLKTPAKKKIVAIPCERRSNSQCDLRHESQSVHKSPSLENLSSSRHWLTEAQNSLKEIRDENVILSEQLLEIDKRISERRKRFKELWGVSPKSINKVRSQKSDLVRKILGGTNLFHPPPSSVLHHSPPQSHQESATPFAKPDINVNIPICLNKQSGNMLIASENQINESSLAFIPLRDLISLLLHPMALKHLSQRVKLELSSLYDD